MSNKIYEIETLYGPLDVRLYMVFPAVILGMGIFVIVNGLSSTEIGMKKFSIAGFLLLYLGGSLLYFICHSYRRINRPGSIERQLAGE